MRQVHEGVSQFREVAQDGIRDLKAQQDAENGNEDEVLFGAERDSSGGNDEGEEEQDASGSSSRGASGELMGAHAGGAALSPATAPRPACSPAPLSPSAPHPRLSPKATPGGTTSHEPAGATGGSTCGGDSGGGGDGAGSSSGYSVNTRSLPGRGRAGGASEASTTAHAAGSSELLSEAAVAGSGANGNGSSASSASGGGGGGGGGGVPAGEADVRRAYTDMKRAYDDMKGLLRKSMGECERLCEEVVRSESDMREAKAAVAQASAEAERERRGASKAKDELRAAEKAASDAKRTLAEEQERHAREAGTEELEILHATLATTVRKATTAVERAEAAEARAAAAEARAQAAEIGRNDADRLRREAQAEAHAAVSAAEAERSTRAQAEGLSESLRADAERRARVFNNAVRSAVGKVQRELEAERDELQAAVSESRRELVDARSELQRALAQADEASADAAARTQDAAAAGHLAVSAEQAAERSRVREAEATESARAAAAAAAAAERAAAELGVRHAEVQAVLISSEAEVARLASELADLRETSQGRCCDLERELARHVERAEASAQALMAAERAVQVAQAQGADAAHKGSTEGAAAVRRVSELEAEIVTLKASGNVMSRLFQMPTLPTKGDVLSGLGLEFTMDDRLRWKSGDVEGQGGSSAAGQEKTRPRLAKDKAALQGGGGGTKTPFGTISLRVWLLVGYLLLLHLSVMLSFTHGHSACDPEAALHHHKGMTIE
ncbi:hypothetical protein FOA52_002677 [Chlamydomonas sp. UWO 241]|nr:hypothetical protein FOA52_002677 [Chlamydomonas sp. UWO 241]